MLDYFGIELNEPGDAANWAARELANFQAIIDLCGQATDYNGIGASGNPRLTDMIFGSGAGLGLGLTHQGFAHCPIDVKVGDSGYTGTLATGTGVCIEGSTIAYLQLLDPVGDQNIRFGNAVGGLNSMYMVWDGAADSLKFITNAGTGAGPLNIRDILGVAFGSTVESTHALDVAGDGFQAYLYQSGAAGAVPPLTTEQADTDVAMIDLLANDLANGDVTVSGDWTGQDIHNDAAFKIRYRNALGGMSEGRIRIYRNEVNS